MKKMLAIVMTFAVLFGIFSVAFAAENGAVDSVESVQEAPEGYTAIRTAEDLNNIRNALAGKYILMNDIDLSVYENWVPIGDAENPFTGELDGNGYVIENLTIVAECNEESNYIGFWGYSKNALMKNILIKNSVINAKDISKSQSKVFAGTLVGYGKQTKIFDSVVLGTTEITGFSQNNIGGIIGYSLSGQNNNCYNYVCININAESNTTHINVGGISGYAPYVERKCSNHADITIKGKAVSSECTIKAGGVDGNGSENIKLINSYNVGKISIDFLTEETYIGGLSGESYYIENVHNFGEIDYPSQHKGYIGAISGNINADVASIDYAPGLKNVFYHYDIIPAYISWAEPDYKYDNLISVQHIEKEEFLKEDLFSGFDFENIWVMSDKLGCPIHKNELTFPEEESTTENTTIPEETEPTTEETTEPVTETTTEKVEVSTTIPEPSTTEKEETTQPTTAPVTEPETQPSTVPEPTTEPATEPTTAPEETTTEPSDDVSPLEDCWLIKFLKQFFNFVCEIFRDILARTV